MPDKKNKFIGREAYLDLLSGLFSKVSSSLVTIIGRRRIGKTFLINEFANIKQSYKFIGLAPDGKISAQDERNEFARQLSQQFNIPLPKANDWGELFDFLAEQISRNKKQTIVLFDEISWMGSKDPTFLSKLKNLWDIHLAKTSNIVLILCGSVSYWIEENILSSTGFLGRVDPQICLPEFTIEESSKLLQQARFRHSNYEKFIYLSVFGGVAWYISLIKSKYSSLENIRQLCFTPNGTLVNEYNRIFSDLFSTRAGIYSKIVKALSKKSLSYDELAKVTKYSSGTAFTNYLKDLDKAGFIKEDDQWSLKTGKISKKARYRLKDNFLRFHFQYIQPNAKKIQAGKFEDVVLDTLLGWRSFIGLQFENLVINNRSLILKALKLNPVDIVMDNPYYQNKTTRQEACQIDYLIQTKQKTLYLCEIKFYNKAIPTSVVNEVKQKIDRLKTPKGYAILPVLIHVDEISDTIYEQEFFHKTIDFTDFLN